MNNFRAQFSLTPPPPLQPGTYCRNCSHSDEMYLDRRVPKRGGEEVPCCGNRNCGCTAHMVATFEVTLVSFFVQSLERMPPAQRQMVMEELESRICLFCGAADPECPCWVEEEAETTQ